MINDLWQAKLWAWTHDPPEKALVLMRREGGGHEDGTVAAIRGILFPDAPPDATRRWDKFTREADHYAAAADRPQFPKGETDGLYPARAQMRFVDQPNIIHPLSGQPLKLHEFGDLSGIAWREAEAAGSADLQRLVQRNGASIDFRRTQLAFWRFGPETSFQQLGALWALLPADSRTPDHGIFAHLDLVSAFSGAMAADAESTPALLTVSLGPVQDFILTARSIADSWAGSHILSCLAWEAIKVVAEEFGPDAILFPALRGLPIVDTWLRDEIGLPRDLFGEPAWARRQSDANPLYVAALPNRFTAVVPASEARRVAESVTAHVRAWILQEGRAAVSAFFAQAPEAGGSALALQQAEAQLAGFPEVHWAAVPWSLATPATPADPTQLRQALAPFYPEGKIPFFDGPQALWSLLSRQATIEGHRFFAANRGALYSEISALAERSLAAAKTLRAFDQLPQSGYRCTLCGEREWLRAPGDDPSQHRAKSPLWDGQNRTRVRKDEQGHARERLCALCSLKRMWRERFAEIVGKITGGEPRSYIVSTHTMALAPMLARNDRTSSQLEGELADFQPQEHVAFPPRLHQKLPADDLLRRVPSWLEDAAEDEVERDRRTGILTEAYDARPEAYFTLALLDGDKMGRWVSGDPDFTLTFKQSFHPNIAETLKERAAANPHLAAYLEARRPASPARQMAISEALNNFALHAAPYALEILHNGKLIYAGGDDVMAMLPVTDAPMALFLLRLLYSGIGHDAWQKEMLDLLPANSDLGVKFRNGFIQLPQSKRLLRMMGETASLSGGLVIAQHTAPLGAVMRSVHAAEKRAKTECDRFPSGCLNIALIKRSGGETRLNLPWWTGKQIPESLIQTGPVLLRRAADIFAHNASRRFVYHLQQRLPLLPSREALGAPAFHEMLLATCALQAGRQGFEAELIPPLIAFALNAAPNKPADEMVRQPDPAIKYLLDFLTVAEFFGRAERHAQTVPAAVRAAAAAQGDQ